MDKSSISKIAKIHPKLRSEVSDIMLNLNNRGVEIRIVQGLRTFEEQHALFLQKPKVTNADAGQSYHNYGLAVDFCLLHKDGSISWDLKEDLDGDKKADWMEVVEEFEKKGWSWGGYWKFKDNPHFEKTFGYNFKQLLELKNSNKIDNDGYVSI
jgi:peptidoglycan LD-endopeptidase CwlK